MEYLFKTETIHDLSVHKEFSKGYLYASKLRNALYLFVSLVLVWYMFLFDNPIILYGFLFVAAIYLISAILRNQKKGDISYRRMLVANSGNPSHMVIHISEDGIHTVERGSENKRTYSYDQFRSLIETERLLILTMPYQLCLILQKTWLQGGTAEELTEYLLSHCPNIKRKKVRKVTFGKWVHRIHAVVLVIGTVVALTNLPSISLWDSLSGRLHNNMTYAEMAAELAPMGIVISEQTISEMEAYDAQYAEENGADYYTQNYTYSKVFDLLYWEGCGVYDEETWEWTPSSSGVYWFDAEVWAVDTIYSDFLTGLSAMHPELNFTNVQEDYRAVDLEAGSGTVIVSFDYNGTHHELEASYDYDWFDTDMLFEVGRMIAADNSEKDLYFLSDGGQGILLYYGDPAQLRQLERKTGLDFHDTVNMFMTY